MGIVEETNNLFTELDEAILNLTLLQNETRETMDLVNTILSKLSNRMNSDKNQNKEYSPINMDTNIETIDDLLEFSLKYGTPEEINDINNNINRKVLYDLIEPLDKLNKIIGMEEIKSQILDLILSSIQGLYDSKSLYHTVITGPPGAGKTLLAKILGEIYLRLGILKSPDNKYIFKNVKRSDLIGKYLGHTAIKTQEVIDSVDGGVLFIDEVYSLGNDDKRDSFSKECIDTINLNLTEKDNFICIIAGYPSEIENCFFSVNPGLKRRFPFRYEIKSYSPEELADIFCYKITEMDWTTELNLDRKTIINFFIENKENLQYFGGDIDNLILNCKTCHSKRVFGKNYEKKIITFDDLNCGFNKLIKSKPDKENMSHLRMYL